MFLCTLGFHAWAKWSKSERYSARIRKTITGVPITDWSNKEFLAQERTCTRCGLYERRLLSMTGQPVEEG